MGWFPLEPAEFYLLAMIHLVVTAMMTGLIWLVQVVHYPLFDGVGVDGFSAYAQRHARAITWVVAPLMLIEMVTAVGLVWLAPSPDLFRWAVIGLAALVGVWLSTAFLQVPCHQRLSTAYDRIVVRRLVSTNWVRTALWSVRCVIAATILMILYAQVTPSA